MSENQRITSRDPQVRAYEERVRGFRWRGRTPGQITAEVAGMQQQFLSLSPDERRTLRYNTAETLRRAAEARGDSTMLRLLGHGFIPGGRDGWLNIDTGRPATEAERRELSLPSCRPLATRR